MAPVTALLEMFGILSWCAQEVRKSQNQDLRADLAWSINSGKMESRHVNKVAQELDKIHILHGCKFCRLISGVGVLDQICCLVSIERVLVYISKHVNIKRVILMAVTMTSCSTALLAAKSILLISHL